MTHPELVPCLWFDDQAEAAANFYTGIFSEGGIGAVTHYPSDNPGDKPPGSVLTVDFELAGYRMVALNGGPEFVINPSISFFIDVNTPAEADRYFALLEEGGSVLMPIASYPWSPRFGWVKDRFGVSWQVMALSKPTDGPTIVPCLMFTGPAQGKAELAMQQLTRIFPDSRIEHIERYAALEGPESSVKHGRIAIAGQPFVTMDSHIEHGFSFDEAVSFQVMCRDQAEIDRYWEALSEGGSKGPCGWLKDRFGISWQVVPARLSEWMTSSNLAAVERALKAIWRMSKLDIASIQAAFDGSA